MGSAAVMGMSSTNSNTFPLEFLEGARGKGQGREMRAPSQTRNDSTTFGKGRGKQLRISRTALAPLACDYSEDPRGIAGMKG